WRCDDCATIWGGEMLSPCYDFLRDKPWPAIPTWVKRHRAQVSHDRAGRQATPALLQSSTSPTKTKETMNAQAFPPAPAGFVACRIILRGATLTHLVELDEHGSNGGRPTVCGLTRFDKYENGCPVPGTADLPGWGMGDSGVT